MFLATLSQPERDGLAYDWRAWARPEQLLPPGPWTTWLILSGRGWGKTRTGAEATRTLAEAGRCGRMALVAPTAADARDVMVEGESGLLAIAPPWNRPRYEPSKRRVTWPNGALATLYSADEPERLRGPQHDFAWCDELRAWKYAQDAWDMLQFGLRLGAYPRQVVTTTPKPTPLIRQLMTAGTTLLTRGSMLDNRDHLAPTFVQVILDKYAGTRLGRQEIDAELLDDVEGALWKKTVIDALRVATAPLLSRVVVGVDPAISVLGCTGIIVAGRGPDGHGYVLADRSAPGDPNLWGKAAVEAYIEFGADALVYENNQGGLMAETVIRQEATPRGVLIVPTAAHAHNSKTARAEPIAQLYSKGRVHHVGPATDLSTLEDLMTTWVQGDPSPDPLDALVWALTDLLPVAQADNRPAVGQPRPGFGGGGALPPARRW